MGLDSPAAGTTDQAIEILESVWSGRLLEPGAQSLAIAYVRVGPRGRGAIAALVPGPRVKLRFSPRFATRTERSRFSIK